ncbi:glycine--tRNA ligase subunit beta, partial [Campylobacter upsaliensis]|nr:glycine--tRNA ligase subunit beta [Campylobacter upsaliensis]
NAFLKEASKTYKSFDLNLLYDFILERIYPFYEANPSFIKAVLSTKNSDLIHIDSAVKALIELSKKTNFNENFSTFKRLANIATKNENLINESLFENEAEKKLYLAFKESLKVQNLKQKLESLFALKPFIDEFFENVMINSENEKLKNNRQALIFAIYNEFLKIADIKELSL